MSKLYVVTRSDLPAGAQLAQSVHAAFAFSSFYPEVARTWHERSNNLVVLAVATEAALLALLDLAPAPAVAFREPDLAYQLTAIAIGPSDAAARLLSSLPLALRAPRAAA